MCKKQVKLSTTWNFKNEVGPSKGKRHAFVSRMLSYYGESLYAHIDIYVQVRKVPNCMICQSITD